MPNKNYISGRRFEYKVIKWLKEQDFYAVRSAGSKGVCDVLAVQYGTPMCIQCKNREGLISKKERLELRKAANKYGFLPIISFPIRIGREVKIKMVML